MVGLIEQVRRSRQWAAAIWAHPDQVDGNLYRARNAPELFSVALCDRAGGELITNCAGNLLQDNGALPTFWIISTAP